MVMLRLYEIEIQTEVPASTTHFAPANSLQEFQAFSKKPAFIEQLHQEIAAQFREAPAIDHNVKAVEPQVSSFKAKVKLGRPFISASYLPRSIETILQIRFGRLPHRIGAQNDFQCELDDAIRKSFCLLHKQYQKESVLILQLAQHYIPRTYVEGYASLFQLQRPWKSSKFPKVVFTANRHLYDDVFNFWTAEAVEHGAKLFLAQHGGNYGISEFPSFSERHETSIADRYITWGWKSKKNTYPGFALSIREKSFKRSADASQLLVVTDQLWTYPRSLFSDTPENSQYLQQLTATLKKIDRQIQQNALLRVHHGHLDAGKSQLAWWSKYCPDIKIDDGLLSFRQRLAESKLLLIAHNGTTIPECFALNFPMIITWSDSYMIVRESAKETFDALAKVGVFHQSPDSAAVFIEKIWHDVDGWWNSKDVMSARDLFTNQFARTTKHPIKFMAEALRF